MGDFHSNIISDKDINLIIKSFYNSSLDENTSHLIMKYMNIYHQVSLEYSNLNKPDEKITETLKMLTKPINEYTKLLNEGINSPAMKLIEQLEINYLNILQDKIDNDDLNPENSYTRVLKTPDNASAKLSYIEDEINGFTKATGILVITFILGIILASLLFYLK